MTQKKGKKLFFFTHDACTTSDGSVQISWDTDKQNYLDYRMLSARRSIGER